MELTKKEKDLFKSLKKRAQVAIDVLLPYPLAFVRKLESLPDEQFEFSYDVANFYADGITNAMQDLGQFVEHIDDVLSGLEFCKELELEKQEIRRERVSKICALEEHIRELKQTNQNNGTNNRTQRPQGDTTRKG